ncbi:MAG: hypothetical protein HYV14_11820 [Elusimicrobia bacterium]|nr:hypothetical protein [Elusimicrobiota bacterium]
MRGAILLALLAACSAPLPPGVERLDGSYAAQGFAWSPGSRRLAFIDGRFPDRTYLVVRDLASGSRTRRRLKGFVLGDRLALARDGGKVLIDAGKIAVNAASRSEPSQRVVLVVDSKDGRIVSEDPIGVSGAAAIAHPAWSPDPVAVWNVKDGLRWKAFGPSGAEGVLDGPAAWRGLLLDEPYLVVSERQTARPRMTVYDLRDGSRAAEWRVALTGAPLAVRLDGSALSARWMSESGTFVLESGDPRTGRRSPLLEAEGEIETAVENERGLYAIAKDPSRRNDTGKDFLSPRVLLVAEKGGQRWSVPWSSHEGRFLGTDPKDGKLLFAVTDRDKPAAWAIEPTRTALTAAGPAIDGRSN